MSIPTQLIGGPGRAGAMLPMIPMMPHSTATIAMNTSIYYSVYACPADFRNSFLTFIDVCQKDLFDVKAVLQP